MTKFTVIIPTRNRPQPLAACLQSFTTLDYPAGAWELIVVNDGGELSFTAVSKDLMETLPLRLVTVSGAGPAAARNAGARLASGDYLAFTDDDCRVTPEWLQQFDRGFAQTGLDALGGQTLNPQPGRAGMHASQFLVDFLYDYMRDQTGNSLLLVSNNVAYRRDAFESVGGFSEFFPLAAAEDMEMSHRMAQLGYRQAYYPPAKVWHYHQLTTWGHVRQQFRYGRGGYYFGQAQYRQRSRLQAGTARQFYRALALALWRSRQPLSICVLIGAAQVAYHAGIRYEGARAQRYKAAEVEHVAQ